jgi:hypothetical protein
LEKEVHLLGVSKAIIHIFLLSSSINAYSKRNQRKEKERNERERDTDRDPLGMKIEQTDIDNID